MWLNKGQSWYILGSPYTLAELMSGHLDRKKHTDLDEWVGESMPRGLLS